MRSLRRFGLCYLPTANTHRLFYGIVRTQTPSLQCRKGNVCIADKMSPHENVMILFYLLTGLIVGMGLSVQTSINGRLRKSLGSPFLTSLVSFLISTVFIWILTIIQSGSLGLSVDLFKTQPFWIWFGGFFGCIFLTGNILLFPKLGAVQTVIFPVLGQITAGLLIDEFGLFHAPISPMGIHKAIGTLLVLAGITGVVLFSHKKLSANNNENKPKQSNAQWFWRLLGVCTGACSTLQITINGQLGLVLHTPIRAAMVSFIVGSLSLFMMVCIQRPKLHISNPENTKNPWWMWTGSFLGALYVIGNAWISPQIGTGAAVVIGLLGLMSAGLIIDQTGILQSLKKPVCLQQIISLMIMFAGVCLIRLWYE